LVLIFLVLSNPSILNTIFFYTERGNETEMGQPKLHSEFKASLGNIERPYLKQQKTPLKSTGRYSACLACLRPWIQSPEYTQIHTHRPPPTTPGRKEGSKEGRKEGKEG
jgi:hypothetical protein